MTGKRKKPPISGQPNAYREPLEFELPPTQELPGGSWRRWIDTSRPSPDDIVPVRAAVAIEEDTWLLPPHSLVVMVASAATESAVTCLPEEPHLTRRGDQ